MPTDEESLFLLEDNKVTKTRDAKQNDKGKIARVTVNY